MADEKKPSAPASAPATGAAGKGAVKKTSAVKKWLIIAGVAILALAIAYAAGWVMGARGKAELEERAEATTRDARLLEARRRLDLAHLALEHHNYGIAEAHVRGAAQILDAATDDGPMADLAREVAETRIGVTSDIAAQQQRLRELIERFDRLHPPSNRESATPAP